MKTTKRVAVVLAGCGVQDGSEIHEAVLTLLYLDEAGAEVSFFAPDIDQARVVNHLTGDEMPEIRNTLVESARIARGKIRDLREAKAADFDALIVPGGFGAAINLSDFAYKGAELSVQKDFLAFAQAVHKAGKPIGLICIAPAMAAKICGAGTEFTIGNDAATAANIEASGGKHIACTVGNTVIDRNRKLVTTPAYMLAKGIGEAATGIRKLVGEVLELA